MEAYIRIRFRVSEHYSWTTELMILLRGQSFFDAGFNCTGTVAETGTCTGTGNGIDTTNYVGISLHPILEFSTPLSFPVLPQSSPTWSISEKIMRVSTWTLSNGKEKTKYFLTYFFLHLTCSDETYRITSVCLQEFYESRMYLVKHAYALLASNGEMPSGKFDHRVRKSGGGKGQTHTAMHTCSRRHFVDIYSFFSLVYLNWTTMAIGNFQQFRHLFNRFFS